MIKNTWYKNGDFKYQKQNSSNGYTKTNLYYNHKNNWVKVYDDSVHMLNVYGDCYIILNTKTNYKVLIGSYNFNKLFKNDSNYKILETVSLKSSCYYDNLYAFDESLIVNEK